MDMQHNKRILVLWASPNLHGLTAAAKDRICQGIVGKASVEPVQLNKCDLHTCRVCGDGWGSCRSMGQCIIGDSFQSLYDKIICADGFVIVTPVYWHDMAEPCKKFFDRLRRCETAYNHKLRGKKCLMVACAGGSGRGSVQCLLKLEEIMGHMQISVVDRIGINRFNWTYMLQTLVSAGSFFAESIK